MQITIKAKSYELANPGEHPAICANAVFLEQHDTGKYGIRDEIELTFYLADQFTSAGRPIKLWKNLTLETGPGAHLPKYMQALGTPLKLVEGQYKINTEPLIGANCRLIIVSGTKQNGQPKSKIADILPPLPGSPTLIIPSEFALHGRTDSQASGGFYQESATPNDSQPVQPAPASRFHSVDEMKAAAGVEKTSTAADLSVNIASVRTKIRKKPGHDSFTTGGNTPTGADPDFPLQ